MKIKKLLTLGIICSSLFISSLPIVSVNASTDLVWDENEMEFKGYSQAPLATTGTVFRTVGCTLYCKQTNKNINLIRANSTTHKDAPYIPTENQYYYMTEGVSGGVVYSTHHINVKRILNSGVFGSDFKSVFYNAQEVKIIFNAIIGFRSNGVAKYTLKDNGIKGVFDDWSSELSGQVYAPTSEEIKYTTNDYPTAQKVRSVFLSLYGGDTGDLKSYYKKELRILRPGNKDPYGLGCQGYRSFSDTNVVMRDGGELQAGMVKYYTPYKEFWVKPNETNYFTYGGTSYVGPSKYVSNPKDSTNYVNKVLINLSRSDSACQNILDSTKSSIAKYNSQNNSVLRRIGTSDNNQDGCLSNNSKLLGLNEFSKAWGGAGSSQFTTDRILNKNGTDWLEGYDSNTMIKLNFANNGDSFKSYMCAQSKSDNCSQNGGNSILAYDPSNTKDAPGTGGWVTSASYFVDGTAPQYDNPVNYKPSTRYSKNVTFTFNNLSDKRGEKGYYKEGDIEAFEFQIKLRDIYNSICNNY